MSARRAGALAPAAPAKTALTQTHERSRSPLFRPAAISPRGTLLKGLAGAHARLPERARRRAGGTEMTTETGDIVREATEILRGKSRTPAEILELAKEPKAAQQSAPGRR